MSWWRTLALLVALSSAATPSSIRVVPEAEAFTVVVSGAANAAAPGAFTGRLALYGSSSELPVSGVARVSTGRLELSMKIRYRDVPEVWANRFRAADFDYRLQGAVSGGTAVAWSATRRWAEVEVDGRKEAMSSFVTLDAISLTEFSLFSSAARAEMTARNPLSFPVRLARTEYRLQVAGREVGAGATAGILLRPNRSTTLELPIALDHGQLLAAAGSALRSGGQVEGQLQGTLVVRLPGGDVPMPFDLSGKFSALP